MHGPTPTGRRDSNGRRWRSGIVAVTVAMLGAAAAVSGTAAADATSHSRSALTGGQALLSGQSMTSANGQYVVTMRTDGQLVETSGTAVLWSTPVERPGSYAGVALDGNFGVYSPDFELEWSAGTAGHWGDALALADTGLLSVIDGGAVLWSDRVGDTTLQPGQDLLPTWTISSPDGLYQLVLHRDGNLSEYLTTPQRSVRIWTTGGGSAAQATMQHDGNFVVYSATGRPLLASDTAGHYGAHLVLTDEADLEVVGVSGRVLWTSESATLRTTIVSIAMSEVGYQDSPKGTYCNAFSAYWGSGGACANGTRSEQWCADFAAWVWRHAGVPFAYGWGYGELDASAASFYHWAVANGTWHSASSGYVPRPGDVAVFGLTPSDAFADHVAVVVTAGAPGVDAVNGDWWGNGNGGVGTQWDETTATGSDVISGYASP